MFLNTDILFTTTNNICGREIAGYLGILIERETFPADISAPEMIYAMDARNASLAAAMNAHAADIGADAVVGVDFRMDVLGNRIVFTMTGNAVRLKPIEGDAEHTDFIPAEEIIPEPAEETVIEAREVEEEVPGDIFVFEETVSEEMQAAAGWKCASCGTENDDQYRFCPRCGAMRSMNWVCDGCGQENPPEYKFCPGCGKPCGV